jgi:hypothetical protein
MVMAKYFMLYLSEIALVLIFKSCVPLKMCLLPKKIQNLSVTWQSNVMSPNKFFNITATFRQINMTRPNGTILPQQCLLIG